MSAPTIGALADRLAAGLDRMIRIQMTAYPLAWSEAERREAAEQDLFGRAAR